MRGSQPYWVVALIQESQEFSPPMQPNIILMRFYTLDIVDCNAGDHGKPFATNFNPEINIREVTQGGKYWENGKWIETEPHAIHKPLNYPILDPANPI